MPVPPLSRALETSCHGNPEEQGQGMFQEEEEDREQDIFKNHFGFRVGAK